MLDDLVDESPDPAVAARQLAEIDRGLAQRLARPGSNLVYVGLADTTRRFGVPVFYFHSLAAGLRIGKSRTVSVGRLAVTGRVS